MHNQVVRLSAASALMGAVVIITSLGAVTGPAQASDGSSSPTAAATAGVPKKVDAAAAPSGVARRSPARREPRPAGPADSDPYRCHPTEDIACTVVRQTAEGMMIVTMRPAGGTAPPAAWSVVSGTPPGGTAYPGGIIYVVPTTPTGPPPFEATSRAHEVTLVTANDAPILD